MMRGTLLAAAIAVVVSVPALAQTSGSDRYPSQRYGTADDSMVARVQQALTDAGYPTGGTEGRFGQATRRAIESYQSDKGLPVTGRIDRELMRSLEDGGYLTAQVPPPRGDRLGQADDNLVADVQTALQRRGYAVDRSSGRLDPETRAAIRAFQRDQGLPVTGQPSAELLALIETSDSRRSSGRQETAGPRLIRQIERNLQAKGYEVGPVDGALDPKTEQAIRTYQNQRGISPTGTASADLLQDLETSSVRAQQSPRTTGDVLRDLGERALEGFQGR